MSAFQWFILFLVLQIIHYLGTWKLYEKAGRKSWEAAVPVYNAIVLMKIIKRPTWWTVLLFIPIINLIMFPVVWVETLVAFGKSKITDKILGVVTLGLYIYAVNYNQNTQYIGEEAILQKRRETTIGSILFAVVVATLVHTYFIQPFTIPTSSLEKSLLVGDFLFVSKMHYGARVPMTTVAAPMVHDSIPLIHTKSYLYDDANKDSWKNKLQLPYLRFPGFEKVKNNDIVCFNWPADTVYKFFTKDRKYLKPIDKKSNYVKRCVGIPGDSLSIKDGFVYINNKKLILPERAKPQYSYAVTYDKNVPIDFEGILAELKVTDAVGFKDANRDTLYISALPFENAEKLKTVTGIKSVTRIIDKNPDLSVFPYTKPWNIDNYGPIYIPQAGKSVALNLATLPLYSKIITDYEGNTLEIKGNDIYINGAKTSSYTFKQNYYWMMGDNRHRSEDSRYWGFVPEDHIVGKPVFIWMSWDSNGKGIMNKIRWERLFTTVSGDGQPQSYFKYFIGLLILYFVGEYFWKKRKAKA